MKDFIVGGKVTSLDLSRDETKLAVCSRDDKIQVMIILIIVIIILMIVMIILSMIMVSNRVYFKNW